MPVPTSDAPAAVETHDDLGYVIPKEEVAAPIIEEKKDDVPADDKIEKPATGYNDEEVAPPAEEVKEVPPVEKTEDEMNEEEKAQKEIKTVIAGLGEGYDKAKIEKFVLDNKMTKEQLAAYVKMTKEEDAKFASDQAAAKVKYRNDSINSLKSDPDFGGENFAKNVDRVEKLLEKNMPSTKKMLTEKGGMLPPYLMKDLLSLSKVLNPIAPLVIGEPPAPEEKDGNFLNDLYK